ncbi:uncharacterized protein I303_100622 [Kwoniella dejecticola CBS 10117]|uniref:Uncharacterized protein n=1 Tax=Kwoniella dejecticola CBS 10117 TaxID=1296121 RepID=A0A1A6AFK5_9TREE|nr:uncharacterized protein I303_00625 [Kwoniella dejecticola CBS 10117]OBR88808.1 hypothetical protein I303_00625 [Kwoniella dejecticola CBS 10117]
MSFLPSLRASAPSSSSSLLSLARPTFVINSSRRYAQIPVQVRSIASTSHRHAAVSSKSRSVQDVEKELEEQKQMMARASRTNPGMDVGSQNLPVFESYVDPQKPLYWFAPGVGDKQYKAERAERATLTRQSLAEIIKRGALPPYQNDMRRSGVDQWRQLMLYTRRQQYIKKSILYFKKMYLDYMKIQAEGTIGQASAVAKDNALQAALNVIRGRRDKMSWELIKENRPPYLVSSRMTVVDPRDMKMAAQVVIRFDTQQALTTQKGNQKPVRKEQRVIENIIFEVMPVDITCDWKVKGKLIEQQEVKKN